MVGPCWRVLEEIDKKEDEEDGWRIPSLSSQQDFSLQKQLSGSAAATAAPLSEQQSSDDTLPKHEHDALPLSLEQHSSGEAAVEPQSSDDALPKHQSVTEYEPSDQGEIRKVSPARKKPKN